MEDADIIMPYSVQGSSPQEFFLSSDDSLFHDTLYEVHDDYGGGYHASI